MINLDTLSPEYITNRAGEKTAVVIPIAKFQELLEDIEDLAALAERKDEDSLSHKALLDELKRDGLL